MSLSRTVTVPTTGRPTCRAHPGSASRWPVRGHAVAARAAASGRWGGVGVRRSEVVLRPAGADGRERRLRRPWRSPFTASRRAQGREGVRRPGRSACGRPRHQAPRRLVQSRLSALSTYYGKTRVLPSRPAHPERTRTSAPIQRRVEHTRNGLLTISEGHLFTPARRAGVPRDNLPSALALLFLIARITPDGWFFDPGPKFIRRIAPPLARPRRPTSRSPQAHPDRRPRSIKYRENHTIDYREHVQAPRRARRAPVPARARRALPRAHRRRRQRNRHPGRRGVRGKHGLSSTAGAGRSRAVPSRRRGTCGTVRRC